MAKAKRPPQTTKKLGGPRVGESGPRESKVHAVDDFKNRLQASGAAILTEYRGLTVGELAELRTALREAGSDYKVFKNTLATIAVRDLGIEDLIPLFDGPTAVAFTEADPVPAAKKLSEFAKRVPSLVLKGGFLDGKVLSEADVRSLAALESREVMLAKAAGMLLSPVQKLAYLFAAPLQQVGALFAQLKDKLPPGGQDTEAPAAEAREASAEAAVAEAAPEAVSATSPDTEGDVPAVPAEETVETTETPAEDAGARDDQS